MLPPISRYLLFVGQDYYPRGGWGDFCGDFDTLAAAKAHLRRGELAPIGGAPFQYDQSRDWFQMVDRSTGDYYDKQGWHQREIHP